MLNWSNTTYKFTFGIGSLATTALMSELWKPILPLWAILIIALVPLLVFVFVHPDEMPPKFVRTAHVFASIWYVLTAIVLSIGLFLARDLPKGWIIYPLFCLAGLVPAVPVLVRALRGRYRLADERHHGGSVD